MAVMIPPGVYFNPSPEECVHDYLKPWIESGCADDAPRHGAVFPVDVYQHSPGELRQLFPPGHTRGTESNWYFVTPRDSFGGQGKRGIAPGGNWKVEQRTKYLDGGGNRRTCSFYLPDGHKTRWLMEELAVDDDAGGKRGAGRTPVFCRIYVSPRADKDERRAILGEDGVDVDVEGKKKPVTVVVGEAYFDMLAARLPASCLRVPGGHVAAPPPGVFGHQAGQVAAPPSDFSGHHHQYIHPDPAAPSPPGVFGHQAGQVVEPLPDFSGHHHQYTHPAAPLPPGVFGHQADQLVAPPPDIIGHHHQYIHPAAPSPPGVFEHQAGQVAASPPDFSGHHHYIHPAAPSPPVVYDHQQGQAAQPQPPAVHGLQQSYVQAEGLPVFLDHYYNGQNAFFNYPPAPPIPVAPQQDEEEAHHVPKKPRPTYTSPAPQPVLGMSSTIPTAPREESPGTALAPPLVDDALPPQPPAIEPDARLQQASKNLSPDGSMDSSNLTHVSFRSDSGTACEPQAQLLFNEVSLDFNACPIDDLLQCINIDFTTSWNNDVLKSN